MFKTSKVEKNYEDLAMKNLMIAVLLFYTSLANGTFLYTNITPTADITDFASRQVLLGQISLGNWFGAFDDTGRLFNSVQPIPNGQTRIWSPSALFLPNASGALGTITLALNIGAVPIGLRLEVYEHDGTGFNSTDFTLLDSVTRLQDSLSSGAAFIDFDFGGDQNLVANRYYSASLSLTQTTNKNTWQSAYWMTIGSALTGVALEYQGFGENAQIPVALNGNFGSWQVRGSPAIGVSTLSASANEGGNETNVVSEPNGFALSAFFGAMIFLARFRHSF